MPSAAIEIELAVVCLPQPDPEQTCRLRASRHPLCRADGTDPATTRTRATLARAIIAQSGERMNATLSAARNQKGHS